MKGQILLTAADGVNRLEMERLLSSMGGKVVGYIEMSGDYQVQFDAALDYNALDAIARDLESWEQVLFADVHQMEIVSGSSFAAPEPVQTLTAYEWTDPWTADFIDTDSEQHTDLTGFGSPYLPSNYQWWAEAVNLPFAWQMTEGQLSDVKVGVIDTFLTRSIRT